MAERFRKKYDPETTSNYELSEARKKYDTQYSQKGKEELNDLSKRFSKKVFFPKVAFGSDFSEDKSKWYKIGFFILISVIIGALSIGGYIDLYNSNNNYIDEKSMYISTISLSWFAFVSTVFLLLNRTRELNLILYSLLFGISVSILSLLTNEEKYTREEIEEHSTSKNISLSMTVFSGIALGYLLFYYIRPDPTAEILKYREEREKKDFEEKLLGKIRKAQKEAIIEEEKRWKELHLKPKEKYSIIEKALQNLEKNKGSDVSSTS